MVLRPTAAKVNSKLITKAKSKRLTVNPSPLNLIKIRSLNWVPHIKQADYPLRRSAPKVPSLEVQDKRRVKTAVLLHFELLWIAIDSTVIFTNYLTMAARFSLK